MIRKYTSELKEQTIKKLSTVYKKVEDILSLKKLAFMRKYDTMKVVLDLYINESNEKFENFQVGFCGHIVFDGFVKADTVQAPCLRH